MSESNNDGRSFLNGIYNDPNTGAVIERIESLENRLVEAVKEVGDRIEGFTFKVFRMIIGTSVAVILILALTVAIIEYKDSDKNFKASRDGVEVSSR